MKKLSARILLYRKKGAEIEFFLVHPGGPFWAKKDEGAWCLPGGEHEADEEPLDAAKREFREETSFDIDGDFIALTPIKQKSGKVISTFAVEGDCDPDKMVSNTCFIDWPPRSGKKMEIPECDRGGWFTYEEAKRKISPGQLGFIDELLEKLNS